MTLGRVSVVVPFRGIDLVEQSLEVFPRTDGPTLTAHRELLNSVVLHIWTFRSMALYSTRPWKMNARFTFRLVLCKLLSFFDYCVYSTQSSTIE